MKERQALQNKLEQISQQLNQTEATRIQLAAELEQTGATAGQQAGEITRPTTTTGQQAGEIARLDALRDESERRIVAIDRELGATRDLLRDSQGQTQRLAGELAGVQDELARKVSEHEVERGRLLIVSEERASRNIALKLTCKPRTPGFKTANPKSTR